MKYISILLLTILLFLGCEKQGKLHSIKLYSNGRVAQEWTATSYPEVYGFGSHSYRFRDNNTGRIIRITGDVVIEPLE